MFLTILLVVAGGDGLRTQGPLWEMNQLEPKRQSEVEVAFGQSNLEKFVKYWHGVFHDLVPHLEMGKL